MGPLFHVLRSVLPPSSGRFFCLSPVRLSFPLPFQGFARSGPGACWCFPCLSLFFCVPRLGFRLGNISFHWHILIHIHFHLTYPAAAGWVCVCVCANVPAGRRLGKWAHLRRSGWPPSSHIIFCCCFVRSMSTVIMYIYIYICKGFG